MISILLADDDELITMALRTILSPGTDFRICATAKNGKETVALYEKHRPDVIISDIRMPYHKTPQTENTTDALPGGLIAAEQILSGHPDTRILLLTTFLDDEYIIRALRIGVSGYLLKQDYGALAASIRAVHSGQHVFGNEITQKMPALLAGTKVMNATDTFEHAAGASGSFPTPHPVFTGTANDLSEREVTLCTLIADGLSNKEIAEKMFLSEGTVRNYLSTILEKLRLRDRTQLAIFYLTGKRM